MDSFSWRSVTWSWPGDEKVVKTVWPNQREKYAMLLLGLEEQGNGEDIGSTVF